MNIGKRAGIVRYVAIRRHVYELMIHDDELDLFDSGSVSGFLR